jgi:nitrogen fixation protein FixH
MMQRKFTGWHMLAMMVAFFGVVIAVNFTMARIAIGSFGGVVVDNSYVASQQFNGWLDQARAQQALGWQVSTVWRPDRLVQVDVVRGEGAVVDGPVAVTATARHPLGTLPDHALIFRRQPDGSFVSTEEVPDGRWTLRLQVTAGSEVWRHEDELR